jgi:DNA-binding transcriptional ArsR family regulator
MLDQLRRDIKTRLDELLGEADKLRQALAAIGSRESTTTASAPATSSPGRKRSRGRAGSAQPPRPAARKPARPRSTVSAPSPRPAKSPASKSADPGATKSGVLAALAGGNAMTAGEIATATGLGRATVSTTLSRLAKTGAVTKAARGYQISRQTPNGPAADAEG